MGGNRPRVSVGLPVFNGEKYLAEALDSLLSQTFTDFELVLSDNASTDGTEDICRAYALKDDRIRYYRNDVNLGAAQNFNRVVELSVGEYFRWAAHDDLCAPEYLERCVAVLDQDSSVILCHSCTSEIDERGTIVRDYEAKPRLGSAKPDERFHECICVPHPQVIIFGLIRASVLKQTRLIQPYSSSDRVLLGELALRGRFHEVPEHLFFRRDHLHQSYRVHWGRHAYQAWFDPNRAGKLTFPHWRLLQEHSISVVRVPLSLYERARCFAVLGWWVRKHWRYLAANLFLTEPGMRTRKSPVTAAEGDTASEPV